MYMDKNARGYYESILENLEILEEVTNYSQRVVVAKSILKGVTLTTKGDYCNAVESMDGRVRTIDTAIPDYRRKEIASIGLDYTPFVTVYWKNGKNEVLNIVAHWASMLNQG